MLEVTHATIELLAALKVSYTVYFDGGPSAGFIIKIYLDSKMYISLRLSPAFEERPYDWSKVMLNLIHTEGSSVPLVVHEKLLNADVIKIVDLLYKNYTDLQDIGNKTS